MSDETEAPAQGADADYEKRLQSYVGRVLLPDRPGQDPVNVPMIKNWVEAVGT